MKRSDDLPFCHDHCNSLVALGLIKYANLVLVGNVKVVSSEGDVTVAVVVTNARYVNDIAFRF